MAVIESGMYTLAIIGLVTTVVSAFYYIRIIKLMFIDTSEDQGSETYSGDLNTRIITSFGAILILMFGLAPAMLLGIVEGVVNILQ